MAQRDYVSKKKGKSKKTGSRVIPNLMLAISIILIALFAAILYMVSTNKPDKKPVALPTKPVTKPQVTLPEKPQERWTYLKKLENPEGEIVRAPQDQAVIRERERILDSFRTGTAADIHSTAVQPSTRPTTQDSFSVPSVPPKSNENTENGKWTVQCGAFKEKGNADSLRAKIAMAGVESQVQSTKLHRVMVGTYRTRAQAEQIVTRLKNNNITNCIISGR